MDIYKEILNKYVILIIISGVTYVKKTGDEDFNKFVNQLLVKNYTYRLCELDEIKQAKFMKDFQWVKFSSHLE